MGGWVCGCSGNTLSVSGTNNNGSVFSVLSLSHHLLQPIPLARARGVGSTSRLSASWSFVVRTYVQACVCWCARACEEQHRVLGGRREWYPFTLSPSRWLPPNHSLTWPYSLTHLKHAGAGRAGSSRTIRFGARCPTRTALLRWASARNTQRRGCQSTAQRLIQLFVVLGSAAGNFRKPTPQGATGHNGALGKG